MNYLIIIGAGQMGRAVWPLINKSKCKVMAYGDNAATESTMLFGVPVLTVEEAASCGADTALIAVAGNERASELSAQLSGCGFGGSVVLLSDLADAIDIRAATAAGLAKRLSSKRGAVAELGVFRGDFSAIINGLFPDRKLYLFDTFQGFDEKDLETERSRGFSRADRAEFADTGAEAVVSRLPHGELAVVRQGYFPKTAEGIDEQFVFVSLDADLYEPTLAGLEWFLPRLVPGGAIMLHDYGNDRFAGVRQAVCDYENRHGALSLVPLCDLHGTAVILKV